MIAIDADRRDRERDRRRSAQFRSRRDRDRGASVWVVRARADPCESRAEGERRELVRVRGESRAQCVFPENV